MVHNFSSLIDNNKHVYARARSAAVLIIAVVVVISYSSGLMAEKKKERTLPEMRAEKNSEKNGLKRHHLIRELAKTKISGIELDLIGALENDPEAVVRQGAAQGLGNYVQNPAVLKALADHLKKENEPAVRYACVLSIGLSNSFKAMNVLENFSDDADPNMRRQVAVMLKRQNNIRSKILLRKLKKDQDPSVRQMAEDGEK